MTPEDVTAAVAVTGMACRFPGAPDLSRFWRNLCTGVDAVQRFGPAELRAAGVAEEHLADPSFVPVCAPIPEPYAFDEAHFGVPPATARLLDPQHRVFVECAWAALEASGALAAKYSAVAVFAGCSDTTYFVRSDDRTVSQGGALAADLGTSSDYLATRVAHLLDLRGPAVTVRTACSTSLVAIHLAVQSLLTEEADVALAGGAAIRHPLRRGHIYEPGGIYASDGACRPYDRRATGIVSGDGAGAVVLRRLGDALADGDHIHAVLRGSAINNDGAVKAGFTAPGVEGQAEVALTALQVAGVDPATIGFVEGHGTATPLGDPIEVAALTRAWSAGGSARANCVLGSVKSGIGHLDAAAGVASFIKACLAVEHGRIPATLHFTEPNPHCGLADSPFTVTAETLHWSGGPRRASVHSLGLGGTNAHVVLEQAPRRPSSPPSAVPVALALSTRRPDTLAPYAEALADALTDDVAGAAYALRQGRTEEPYRRVVVGESREQLRRSLRSVRPPTRPAGAEPRLVIAFPGDGSRVLGALRELAERLPVVARTLRAAEEHVQARWDVDLNVAEHTGVGVLPAIVAQGIALHAGLTSFGAGGDVVLGQSLGELTAAAAAGLIGMQDALDLAMAREAAFRSVVPSGGLAIGAAPETVAPRLGNAVELSLVNSPHRCVVSGTSPALAELAAELEAEGIVVRRLDLISAVHCSLLDPVLDDFGRAAGRLRPRHPERTLVSTVGPAQLDISTASDPQHWVRQLREPVHFDRALRSAVAGEGDVVVVDVGPARGLAAAIQETVGDDVRAVVSLTPQTEDVAEIEAFGLALGRLWEEGLPVVWDGWPRPATARLALPSPPLARTIHAPDEPIQLTASAVGLWARGWQRVRPSARPERLRITVLEGTDAVGLELTDHLVKRGHEIVTRGADLLVDARALGAIDGPAATAAMLRSAAATTSGRLVVLTRGAHDILGSESLSPASAAVAAATLVASQEHGHLQPICLDVEEGPVDVDLLERTLLSASDTMVALRGRSAWRPVLEEITQPVAPQRPSTGVWVITGGLGRFGRWVGRWLAEHGCHELVLLGRTGAQRSPEAIAAIRAAGAHVTIVQADVTDRAAMFRALDDAHHVGGGEMTILHLAGEPNSESAGSPVADLVRGDLRAALIEQWSAKVSGAQVIFDWVRRHPRTRCVTFSSNASLLGGPGLAAYAAANAALDTLAVQAGDREGLRWRSIGWDGWRLLDDPPEACPSALDAFALSGGEPWRALLSAMAADRCHVAVAKDAVARHRRWVERPAPVPPQPVRPAVEGGAPDALAAVRKLWGEVVGRTPLDDDADLFAEGGDSLVAMRIRSRLEHELHAVVTLRDVMANRTVAGLAALVRDRARPSPSREPAAQIVRGRI